jgi:NTP pyrophosphatase (non-canonical NTP hydrolase)
MGLTMNDYQKLASRTAKDMDLKDALIEVALGSNGEAGEFGDMVKKIYYHGHPFTPEIKEAMIKELGDKMWYIARACGVLGVTLEHVGNVNLMKLATRYPEGFSTEASLKRVDTK